MIKNVTEEATFFEICPSLVRLNDVEHLETNATRKKMAFNFWFSDFLDSFKRFMVRMGVSP